MHTQPAPPAEIPQSPEIQRQLRIYAVLIDEDLSPWVAERLRVDQLMDAVHVRDRGRLGRSDREVLELAFTEDRILVTANVTDFERLARAAEIP